MRRWPIASNFIGNGPLFGLHVRRGLARRRLWHVIAPPRHFIGQLSDGLPIRYRQVSVWNISNLVKMLIFRDELSPPNHRCLAIFRAAGCIVLSANYGLRQPLPVCFSR